MHLSPRQREALGLLIGSSMIDKEIAAQMGITHGTFKVYSSRLYRILSASGRIDLMHREIERLRRLGDEQEQE